MQEGALNLSDIYLNLGMWMIIYRVLCSNDFDDVFTFNSAERDENIVEKDVGKAADNRRSKTLDNWTDDEGVAKD